jgi:hypothetical protein
MSASEAEYLDIEHQAGKHAHGEMVCPACLSQDLKAKEEATILRAAQILEQWEPGLGLRLRRAMGLRR